VAVLSLTEQIRFIESVFGAGRLSRNSRNFDVRCPICDPKDPTKKKLAILVPEGKVHCWSCGYKAFTLAPLIRKYGSRDQLNDYRDRFMPAGTYGSNHRDQDDVVVEPEKLKLPSDFRLLATAPMRDPDVLAMKHYLITRHISDRDLWYFKLGYSHEMKWKRRIIMPSFDSEGELNFYVGRAIDKFRKPKYDNPDIERLHLIFNEINIDWTQRLVLCEGPFDLMKCGDNAVPLLGSDLNEQSALFNKIIAHNTPVALALDADMKLTKTPYNAKKLIGYDVDVLLVDVPGDPGEMSKQEFRAQLDAAKPFNWHDSFLDKLERASKMSL